MGARLVGVAVAGVVSFATSWVLIPLGKRVGFVDRPDGRLKQHVGSPVPLGGVAVMLALHTGLALAGPFDAGLLVGTGLVFAIGLVDDKYGLPPLLRLMGTVLAGALMVAISDVVTGAAAAVAGTILVVVAVNAVNLLDGLDGLAASVCGVAATGLGLFAVIVGSSFAWQILVLPAAIVGFLYFNWSPARLYLGDNGAYVIGVVLAWATLSVASDWQMGLLSAALIGVPLLDLGVTVIRRIRTGVELFSGDRDHSYDRLFNRLGSAPAVSVAFALFQAAWSALLIGVYVLTGAGVAVAGAGAAGLVLIAVAWSAAPPSLPGADPGSPPAQDPSSPGTR